MFSICVCVYTHRCICYCCCCQVASVVSDSVWPHRRQPTRLPQPWDSPGKNTGVGCHCLLQCMKVKSESEVAQSCPTLCDPMDHSLPGSSVHGIFQARVLEWGAIAFSTDAYIYICIHTHTCIYAVYAQLCLTLHDSMDSSPPGSSVLGIFRAKNTGVGCIVYSRGSAQPMDWICVSWVSRIGRRILYHYRHLGCLMQSVGTDLCLKKVSHCLSEVHM